MKFIQLSKNQRSDFQPGIVAIEKTVTYPFGDDFFKLDHGIDYFAFFDRLGEVYYYLALEDDVLAATGAGILRQIPYRKGEIPSPAWYLCDLKVHPDFLRRRLSLRMIRQGIYPNILRCTNGYGISMNPGDGKPNRFVRLLQRFPLVKFRCSTILEIYTLDAATMYNIEPLLIEHRGPISYLSLQGIKDLRLESKAQAIPLLHLQWGSTSKKDVPSPMAGYKHMFCVPTDDELAKALSKMGIYPCASASVVSHGMDNSDWKFILTSDI
jgi:hypothetical protein